MPSSKSVLIWLSCLVVFMALAFGADSLFSRMILASDSVDAAKVGRAVHQLDDQEIPVFGSSKALADYDPEVLGPRFYNYGLSLTGLNVTNVLLTYELKKASHQPVVIDLHPEHVHEIGDPSNYIPYASHPEVEDLLRRAGQWKWYYKVPGLRYFGSYDWYTRDLLGQKLQMTKTTVRGYSKLLNVAPWNPNTFAKFIERRRKVRMNFGMDPVQKARLVDLIRSAPDRKFFIVVSPMHQSSYVLTTRELRFRAELESLDQLPNVQVLDYMRKVYSDEYWRDTSHLNDRGAALFSMELRDRIEAEVPGSTGQPPASRVTP